MDPRGPDPYARDPRTQDPYAGDTRTQDPYAGDPRSYDPYAGDTRTQDPYTRDPYARDPHAPDPYAGGAAPEPRGTPPGSHDLVALELRNLSIDRIRRMNAMHGTHAWDRRRREPIGPHGLAFLYRDQIAAGDPPRYRVAAATRLFLDGDDVRNLHRLLYEMTTIARDYLQRGGFDPRLTMTDRQEEMSGRAQYIGLGVSTLDTQVAPWDEFLQQANGPLDIPGSGYVLLADGTRMIVERGGGASAGSSRLYSSRPLTDPMNPVRVWTWLREDSVPGRSELWQWMNLLHEVACEGDRRAAAARWS
ncbi:MAG TPA: hypothetical protein VFR67_20010 [Pilimelia sp.]|nr:hypothetical protein [Pilimelia sp.]